MLYVHLIGNDDNDNDNDNDNDDNEEQDCWSSPSLISECVRANLSNRDVSYWAEASPSFLQNQSAHHDDDDDDYHDHSYDDDGDDDGDDNDVNDHGDVKDCDTMFFYAKCNCWI